MGMGRWIHLEDCRIVKITGEAILIECDDDEHWIPKSQISDPDVYDEGDEGVTVSITEWFANKEGI